jgi:peptidoglycan/LPS O-acetylase OafA/YrhL
VLVSSQMAEGLGLLSMLAIAAVILAAGSHAPRRPSVLTAQAATLSFALFITHNLVGLLWFKALALSGAELSAPAAWAAWALVFPVCLAAAWAFHRWADTPVQAWLRPRINRGLSEPARVSAPLIRAA